MGKEKIKWFRNPLAFSCNVYVLSGEKGTVLVDPGHYDRHIRAHLAECGGLDAVLVTHSHWDQISGLEQLKEDYPDVPVYHHVLDEGFAEDSSRNGSGERGVPFVSKTEMQALTDGIHLIGGYTVRVIHAPGHTVGSCVYVFSEEDVVFTGDSVLLNTETDLHFPTGCPVCHGSTVEKMRWLPLTGESRVCCGHHRNGTYAMLLTQNPHLNRRFAQSG